MAKSMTLEEAYEIAGGYNQVPVSEETFAEALEMVRQDDEEMAKSLKEARDHELSLKAKMKAEEEIVVDAGVLAENTEYLYKMLVSDSFDDKLHKDPEIIEAIKNTPIIDTDDGQTFTQLSDEEKSKQYEMLFEKSKLDTLCELSRNKDFGEKSEKEKEICVFEETKMSFLGTLMELRTTSLLEKQIPEYAKAYADDDEDKAVEFFSRQQVNIASNVLQDKACNFGNSNDADPEVVEISKSQVIFACSHSEAKAEEHRKKIIDSPQRNDKAKRKHLNTAASYINKFKTSFSSKAHNLWKERFVVANNLRDKAPKIITDVSATIAVAGISIANAPWLTGAVLTYGAYKVASSWAWPIITEARREARIERKEGKPSKVKFVDRLREASENIFNNKDKRMAYFKEAGWGTAAGLVGLGAAGAATSAIAAKAAQSMANMAVRSFNNAINTVNALKNKNMSWTKKLTLGAGALIGGGLLYDYISDHDFGDLFTDGKVSTNLPTTETTTATPAVLAEQEDTLKVPVAEPVAPKVEDVKEQLAAATQTAVKAPEVWTAETGITQDQWAKLQTYWNEDPEKYQEFYARIDNKMLEKGGIFEGMTRDQVLFRYERLSSWNSPSHEDTIKNLDNFFECREKITLTEQDINILRSVNEYGEIEGVIGTKNIIVVGRNINCQEGSSLVIEEVSKKGTILEETTPTNVETLTPTGGAEALSNGNVIHKTDGQLETQYTVDKEASATVYQGNNQTLVEQVENIDANKVTTDAENVNIKFNGQGNVTVEATGEAYNFNANGESTQVKVEATGEAYNFNANGESTQVKVEATSEARSFNLSDRETPTPSETEYEFFEDGDDVEKGTPAAGNVDARGGFENTGLTEQQVNATKVYFQNMHGENAYDDFAKRITDEMRAKGGVFEGKSVEQSMYAVMQMDKWSDENVGEFAKEIKMTLSYLKECDESLTEEQMNKIKLIIDRVNDDGTMEGVIGKNAVNVVEHQVQDCGETGVRKIVSAAEGHTEGSGSGMREVYMRPIEKATSSTPVITRVEGQQALNLTENQSTDATVFKGNNTTAEKVVATDVTPSSVETDAKNVKISTQVVEENVKVSVKYGNVQNFNIDSNIR